LRSEKKYFFCSALLVFKELGIFVYTAEEGRLGSIVTGGGNSGGRTI